MGRAKNSLMRSDPATGFWPRRWRTTVKRRLGATWATLAAAGLAAAILILYRTGWWFVLPRFIRASGIYGAFVSYGLIVLQTVVPFAPFAFLATFNAVVHGYWVGAALTVAGAFSGAMLVYTVSFRLAQTRALEWMHVWQEHHPRLRGWIEQVGKERGWSLFLAVLLLRMQPWLPSSVIDLAAGVSRAPWLPYAAATALGQGPMVALEAYVGYRVLHVKSVQTELWVLGAAALLSLFLYVGTRLWLARRNAGG